MARQTSGRSRSAGTTAKEQPAQYLERYFRREDDAWVISPEIRRMVQFRELNLTEHWRAMPRFDAVFFRNVLIYFPIEKKREIFRRLIGAMQPDAYLLLGTAESTYGLTDAFARIAWEKTAYYRLQM